jgi:hypothetical protein
MKLWKQKSENFLQEKRKTKNFKFYFVTYSKLPLTVRSFIVLLYWQALTLHKGF